MGARQYNSNAGPTSDEIMQQLSKMTPGTIAPGVEAVLPSAADMETTPEFFSSDNNNSSRTPSDQPSPAALNCLSGTSYPGPQQPFPTAATTTTTQTQPQARTQTQTQTSSNQLDIPPSASTTGTDPCNGADPCQTSGQSSVSANGQFYRNNPETPFLTTGPESSFTMPSPPNWDFSTSQPFVPSPGNVASGISGPFNEAQLEQLVSSNNWGAWRG